MGLGILKRNFARFYNKKRGLLLPLPCQQEKALTKGRFFIIIKAVIASSRDVGNLRYTLTAIVLQ